MADSLSGTSPALEVDEHAHKGRTVGYLVCWLLGNGCLFSWNSLITIQDYFLVVFDGYHAARVFTLVYQPFALGTMLILTYHEARINTRLRLISGYTLFFIFILAIPILDLATNGHGGIGAFVGTCIFIAGFGVADAFVQGGMFGEVSFMDSSYVQAFSAGLAASGAITSGLRLICKSSFPNTKDGLRNSALVFFFISAFFEFTCILLYAYVFPRLAFVKYFRTKAASEGSLTVSADLVAVGSTTYRNETLSENCDFKLRSWQDNQQGMKALMPLERLTTSQLLAKNADYCFIICFCFTLTLSIFPGFLAEDTGKHHLGTCQVWAARVDDHFDHLTGSFEWLRHCVRFRRRTKRLFGTGAKCLGEHSRSFSGYWPLCWSRCRLVVADRKGLVEVQVFENLNQVHYLIPFE
ncbi:equilibrative nucleotide transporter 2 isoform X3 [Physcomitrium patens]|uniref:equilibrative nucleotide transporter 2 isoform X3 n=1 Tax=Physcomitrium patens TaxID=3218 RepID=UPI003CCCCED4